MTLRIRVATLTGLLAAAALLLPPAGRPAEAQNAGCYCFASFDATDSDLRFAGRYFNSHYISQPEVDCASSCDAWWRDWFYWQACDVPQRINRGKNAWWGYDNGSFASYIGPDTWWCPFPPP